MRPLLWEVGRRRMAARLWRVACDWWWALAVAAGYVAAALIQSSDPTI